jgi:hypothetical protein
MRKLKQSTRKADGWVERKRRLRMIFAAADKRRALVAARESEDITLEKVAAE